MMANTIVNGTAKLVASSYSHSSISDCVKAILAITWSINSCTLGKGSEWGDVNNRIQLSAYHLDGIRKNCIYFGGFWK